MNQHNLMVVPRELIADSHLSLSKEMISAAARLSDPCCCAVLGCGNCRDVPIDYLTGTFHQTDYVDLDTSSVQLTQARRQSVDAARHMFRFFKADLTGLVDRLSAAAEEVSLRFTAPQSSLDSLSSLLLSTRPDFWRPPTNEQYNCIICSTVLTQLQASVRNAIERIVLARYPTSSDILQSYGPWKKSLWAFARRIEDAFLDHLDSLSAPRGIIYLSDTVTVSWLRAGASQSFITEGTWIATRTGRIADYLRPWHEIITERSWCWTRKKTEGVYLGRLYGVQAMIYRVR